MNPAQLAQLIKEGESATVEFKLATPREPDLAQRLCGIANTTTGGYLIIGIEDSTWRIIGVTNPAKDIDDLLKAARKCEPEVRFNPATPEIVQLDNKTLVVASIPPNDGTIYQFGGTFLIRRGTHTLPMTTSEVKRYMYQQGVLDWESQPVSRASLSDINLEMVKVYRESLQRFTRRLVATITQTDLEELLIKTKCAVRMADGAGIEHTYPTNAGLILFGLAAREIYNQAEVILTHYQDNSGLRRYSNRKIISGTIPEMIEQTSETLSLWTPVAGEIKGFRRIDEPELPLEALREAVINALVHRDYSIEGTAVRVFYYSDRVEIYNPGRLMPGLNLEKLREGQAASLPRNPVIASILRDLPGGYMERVGSGIRFMIAKMREYGLPDPEFRETDIEFVVTFYRAALTTNNSADPQNKTQALTAEVAYSPPISAPNSTTSSDATKLKENTATTKLLYDYKKRRELALEYVRKNGSISTKEYRAITNASERTAIRDLDEMVTNGIVRPIGNGSQRRYII